MALEQSARSGKAVGTRDRVVAWLAANGDVEDATGMASTALAGNIGYPGSSIAFAQLLSGMERSGLIVRDVRGKRTYRVSLTEAGRERAVAGPAGGRRPSGGRRYGAMATPPPRRGAAVRRGRAEEDSVDYDELARRLLFQVARRLSVGGAPVAHGGGDRAGGAATGEPAGDDLEQRLGTLEVELARARAARVALEEENEELRGQLERIRSNLEGGAQRPVRTRVPPAADQIDHRDIALLQQMLVDRDAPGGRRRDKADSA
ncbi:MAG: hypothetical protein ACRDYZ_07120 [Acidimicrobiales bacterium]